METIVLILIGVLALTFITGAIYGQCQVEKENGNKEDLINIINLLSASTYDFETQLVYFIRDLDEENKDKFSKWFEENNHLLELQKIRKYYENNKTLSLNYVSIMNKTIKENNESLQLYIEELNSSEKWLSETLNHIISFVDEIEDEDIKEQLVKHLLAKEYFSINHTELVEYLTDDNEKQRILSIKEKEVEKYYQSCEEDKAIYEFRNNRIENIKKKFKSISYEDN